MPPCNPALHTPCLLWSQATEQLTKVAAVHAGMEANAVAPAVASHLGCTEVEAFERVLPKVMDVQAACWESHPNWYGGQQLLSTVADVRRAVAAYGAGDLQAARAATCEWGLYARGVAGTALLAAQHTWRVWGADEG